MTATNVTASDQPIRGSDVRFRRGSVHHAHGLAEMLERCSEESVHRRFPPPIPRLSRRLARTLAQPVRGWNLLAMAGQDIIGVATVTFDGAGNGDVGVLVEDSWQRRGIGARLLSTIAAEASGRGFWTLACAIPRDHPAMLATIRRAGLSASVATVDGGQHATVPIDRLPPDKTRQRDNKLDLGAVSAPLVALLHHRHELRDVVRHADLIDQVVRGGV